jgi:hypothetical protein
MEPGIEAVDVAQRRQLAPGEHQRLLDGVLGETEIAQDPKRDREQTISSPTCQAGERFLIPALACSTRVDVTLGSSRSASDLDAYRR